MAVLHFLVLTFSSSYKYSRFFREVLIVLVRISIPLHHSNALSIYILHLLYVNYIIIIYVNLLSLYMLIKLLLVYVNLLSLLLNVNLLSLLLNVNLLLLVYDFIFNIYE